MREDNRKYITDALMKTDRLGMDGLIEYMDHYGFFTTPCSGGNHLACPGGLAEHTVNVMELAEKIGVTLLGGASNKKQECEEQKEGD